MKQRREAIAEALHNSADEGAVGGPGIYILQWSDTDIPVDALSRLVEKWIADERERIAQALLDESFNEISRAMHRADEPGVAIQGLTSGATYRKAAQIARKAGEQKRPHEGAVKPADQPLAGSDTDDTSVVRDVAARNPETAP